MSSRPMNVQEALAKFAAELAAYKEKYGRYQHAKVLERLDAAIERVNVLGSPISDHPSRAHTVTVTVSTDPALHTSNHGDYITFVVPFEDRDPSLKGSDELEKVHNPFIETSDDLIEWQETLVRLLSIPLRRDVPTESGQFLVHHVSSPSVCPHCHGVKAGAHSPASAKHTEGEPQRRGT